MIKFLLDALNNCDSKKAKYIKSLYYKYCQYLYDEVNDSIYNNEELFKLFISEFIDVDKVVITNYPNKVYKYTVYIHLESITFMADRSSEHTIAHLRSIIRDKNKWDKFHKIVNKDERIINSTD